MKDFEQDIWNLARIKFGEVTEEVEQRLIVEVDAIKGYGRGEMLHTMWRLVDELKKSVSLWAKVIMCHWCAISL